MHIKRQNIPKFWPVPKKGTKYVAVATHNQRQSIPLVIVMRDILKLVRSKKELKTIVNERKILINHREIRETNYPVCFLDVVSFKDSKKHYRAVLNEKGKITLEEISEKEADKKFFKVIGKRILKKAKLQLNLRDGFNVLVDSREGKDIKVNDSVLYNFKTKKVEKVIKLEKGKRALVIGGKHLGMKGEIIDLIEEGGERLIILKANEHQIKVQIKNIIVME